MTVEDPAIAQRNRFDVSLVHTVPPHHLPPPYDRHPDFPMVIFDAEDQPYPVNAPPNMVCQLVPAWENNYAARYQSYVRYRKWSSPERVYAQVLSDWEAGAILNTHPSIPNVRVVGVSRGMPRFVCTRESTVFVVDELGAMPPGSTIGGALTGGMVAVRGVRVPNHGNSPPQLHLYPSEQLIDPPLPGLPEGLTPEERNHWLPPPPIFHRGRTVPYAPDFDYARINHYVSKREHEEGGGSNGEFVIRGNSYRILHGPHTPSQP